MTASSPGNKEPEGSGSPVEPQLTAQVGVDHHQRSLDPTARRTHDSQVASIPIHESSSSRGLAAADRPSPVGAMTSHKPEDVTLVPPPLLPKWTSEVQDRRTMLVPEGQLSKQFVLALCSSCHVYFRMYTRDGLQGLRSCERCPYLTA